MAVNYTYPDCIPARIALITSTTADSQTLLENSGTNSSIKLINSIYNKPVMTFYIVLAAFLWFEMDKVELSFLPRTASFRPSNLNSCNCN